MYMDELEKILEFVDTEISLVEGLERIGEIEVQHLEELCCLSKKLLKSFLLKFMYQGV